MSKYIIELDDRIKLVTSVGVTENGVVYTTSDYVHNLEELNSDYINEHFGELQDEAYQKGFEDGKKSGYEKGLNAVGTYRKGHAIGYDEGYEDGKNSYDKNKTYQRGLEDAWEAAKKIMCDDGIDMNTLCTIFRRGCSDSIIRDYSASEAIAKLKAYGNKRSDRIEVGDEVEWEGEKFTILRVFTPKGCYEQCDGFDDAGNGYTNILTKDVKKTGKRYDIQSILGAMKS